MNWSDKETALHSPSPGAEVSALLAQAKGATRAGRKAEARYLFGRVLEVMPDHPDALLWMAYLSGGGRPSLTYLARLLDVDPGNERARAAIRWARNRARPASGVVESAQPRSRHPARPRRMVQPVVAILAILVLGLGGGLASVAFILEGPSSTPTPAQLLALATATNTATASPTATATPLPSATPTETATPTPLPSPTSTPTPTATPTATEPPPTPTPLPPTPVPPTATSAPLPTTNVGDSFRWIDVDLTHQLLVAYEGNTPVRRVIVSTGLPRTPTVTGRFQVYVKYRAAPMSGPGYYLPNVPYIMYFYGSYGLHGTYWHNNFGQPMSHGCVNLPTPEAEWLFNWASVGTPVVVHY